MSLSPTITSSVYEPLPYHGKWWIWFLAVVLLPLLLWRLWKFTIRPRLHPDEPKELPYWIPYFGHTPSLLVDYNALLEYGRTYFKDSKEPYSVWLAGIRMYIITSPVDVAECYRNTTTISYHNIITEMYRTIGVSKSGMAKMFAVDPKAKYNKAFARPQTAAVTLNYYHRLQLQPGEHFDDLLYRRILPGILRTLDFDSSPDHPAILTQSNERVTVSVLALCNELFVRGTMNAYMGAAIWKVNPKLLDAFRQWERTNWKYIFQMPDFMSKDMVAARDEIFNSFERYLRLPQEQRSDCSHWMRSSEQMVRELGVSEEDQAKVFMLHFWAILGNMYKVAFWAIAHLAYDPTLLQSIRAEVMPSVKKGELDEAYLVDRCPKLDSFINEILRLTVASPLVRETVAPTVLGGKILQPGNKLLIPYRQLHTDRVVWGDSPLRMEPYRFEQNGKLQTSKSYRPFGGGNTLCPGRFVAKRSLGYTLALLVIQYEMSVDIERTKNGGPKTHKDLPSFPRLNITKPSPGAGLPFVGDDVVLQLKKRSSCSKLGEI